MANGKPSDAELLKTLEINESLTRELGKQLKSRKRLDGVLNSIFRTEGKFAKLQKDYEEDIGKITKKELTIRNLKYEGLKASQNLRKQVAGQLQIFSKLAQQAKVFIGFLLVNPFVAIGAAIVFILKTLAKVNKALAETRKSLGVSAEEALILETRFKLLATRLSLAGLEADDVKSAFNAIRANFGGLNASTNTFVANLARAQLFTGTSAENIANFLAVQESVSDASRETLLAQLKTTAATIRLAGVAPGAIFKQLAEDADALALNIKDGGANLIGAAVQARKLGIEFKTVTGIADKLLDFESSIESQLKASLLIGRDINLDRARTLALNNDLTGALEEVVSQVGGEAEFNELNRIQRQALAESVGVSVGELSRLVRDNANAGAAGAAQVALSGEQVQNRILQATVQVAANTGENVKFSKSIAGELVP